MSSLLEDLGLDSQSNDNQSLLDELGISKKKSWNIAGDPEAFKNQVEDFEGKYGIAGANKMFTKLFGSKDLANTYAQRATEAAKTYPKATKAGELGAAAYSSIPFMMTSGGLVSKALPNVPKLTNLMASGALGGGAMGALETPTDDETRLGNTMFGAGVGALAPGLGKSLGYGLGKAAKGAKFIGTETAKSILDPSRLAYSNIAKEAEKTVGDLVTKGSNKFKNIFETADKAGYGKLNNFHIPPKLAMHLRKFAGKQDYNEALKRFFKNPTLDYAKKLSSDLFKFTKNYQKLDSTTKTSTGNMANKAAINFRKILEDGIKDNIKKAGGDKLLNSYNSANKFWGDKVAGPANSSLLRKFKATPKKLTDKDFVKDIVGTKAGRAELKELVPSATYRDILNKVGWLGAGGGLLTGSGYLGKSIYDATRPDE